MIIRKKIDGNYTRIPNTPEDYLNDPTITAKSKGILTQLLSKPDSWDLNVNYLVKTNREGHSAIRSAINELISFGYIHRDVVRDEHGRIRGTHHIIFDHRVSAADAEAVVNESPLKNTDKPLVQEGSPRQAKSNSRITAPGENNRMRKIQMQEITPVVKNNSINKLGVATTTTQKPEPKPDPKPGTEDVQPSPSSYPATEFLNLIPEQHQQPMVISLVNKAVKKYTALEVQEAILYASANVRGGAMQYKAYLDKTLKNQWAAGYLETVGTAKPVGSAHLSTSAVLSPGGFSGGVPSGRYPNGTVTGSARMDGNYMAAAKFLARRRATHDR